MKFSELVADVNRTFFKCPKCGSENILTEKRPNGFSTCDDCKHKDKTVEFNFVEKNFGIRK